jgi:hypothetical protein
MIASPLIWNCLTSKHPAYSHEQEVLLVILGLHDQNDGLTGASILTLLKRSAYMAEGSAGTPWISQKIYLLAWSRARLGSRS